MDMTRRDFLGGLAAVAVVRTRVPFLDSKGRTSSYSFVFLGDIHYSNRVDSPYLEMWKDRVPRLIAAAGRSVRGDTAFALQIGDLVHGDADGVQAHAKMFGEAWNILKGEFRQTPISIVAGNHDVRGKGAYEAYRSCLLPKLSRELGRDFSDTNYAYPVGDDAFIHVDYNRAASARAALASLLDETRGARHTFLVVHAPVIPVYYGWSYRSILFGDPQMDAERLWLLDRLAERNAIVLCGHVHTNNIVDWRSEKGRIVQLAVSSVWNDAKPPAMKTVHATPSEYGRFFERQEWGKAAAAFYAKYRRGLASYRHMAGAGYACADVGESYVRMTYFAGDAVAPFAEFEVTAPC